MRNCGICGINLVDGHKICLECFGKLVEEEAMLFLRRSRIIIKVTPSADTIQRTYYNYARVCNHCWPFDCRCY